MEVALGRQVDAVILDQRLVGARPVDEAVAHVAVVDPVFQRGLVAVVDEIGVGEGVSADPPQPAERVVAEVEVARRPVDVDQPVLDVVAVGEGAVARQVAVGVVGEGGAALRRDLVEAVGGGDGLAGDMRRPGVGRRCCRCG